MAINVLIQPEASWWYNNDNVDKPFVKELQTIPHILKLYIWKISHFTLVLSGSLVGWPSSGANIQPLARIQGYTGLNTRICMKMKVLGTDFKKTSKKGSFFLNILHSQFVAIYPFFSGKSIKMGILLV